MADIPGADYNEQRGDGWYHVYPQEDGTYRDEKISDFANTGIPIGSQPQANQINAYLESILSQQAQQQAYSQAQQAAQLAYQQAALAGQNEASARSAAIQAGSNALSSYIGLLNAYGGGEGLDPNAIAAFIRGESGLSLPSGPTLEARKFDLQKRMAEAELQANPRNIFALAAYNAGQPQPSGTTTTSGGGAAQSPADLEFFKQLQAQFGSAPSSQFPFAPQTPLPMPNQIPLNWYSQQTPFKRSLLESAYSTAGLTEDVLKQPFEQASQAFGGTATPLRSSY